MNTFTKILVGLAIIVAQTFIGARAFFPDAFLEREDPLQELLDNKNSVLDKVNPEDLAAITHNPRIVTGVDPNFYPVEMFDERGRYAGLGADYMRLISKMTGLEFKPVAASDWAETEKKAREGEIDMFMAAAKTGRRSDFMLFTAPYINMPGIIMTKRGSGLDKVNIKDLAGKKVAVTQDYSWHDFLKEMHPEITPVPAANTLEALQKVVSGEADAILDYEFNLLEKIQTAGILQMQAAGEVDSAYGHAIAMRKDRPELFNIISIALQEIAPKERERLARKWLERETPPGDEKRVEWYFFFFVESVLVIMCLLWAINHEIRREVKRKVARFKRGEARLKPQETA